MRLGILVAAIVAIEVGACSSTATPTPSPTPVVSPSPSPSPSPTPFDVAKAFLAQLAGATSTRNTFSGTLQIGALNAQMSGTGTNVGSDSDTKTLLQTGSGSEQTENIHKSGVGYTKQGNGPWLTDIAATAAGKNLSTLLKAISSVSETGTETRGGRLLHKLEVARGTVIDPASLGFTDPSIKNATVTLVFYAADDGTPVVMTLSATWTQTIDGADVPVNASIDFAFVQIGGLVSVSAPDHVWQRFASKLYHYNIAYPDDWDATVSTSSTKPDELFSPGDSSVAAQRYKLPSGATLNLLASELIALDEKGGFKFNSNEAFTLDGHKARLLTFHGTTRKVVVYELLSVNGSYFWDVGWFSPAGHETVDKALFEETLSTFTFA